MWPFTPKEKSQSLSLKETSAAEDWDLSLWLLDPDRTVEELDYFAETGQRPTKFTKLTQKVLPTEIFPAVSYPNKAAEKEKSRANFPPNPAQGYTFLDFDSGTYYLWSGTKWKVLANTPPQPNKSPRTKEGVKEIILNLKRPVFGDQLEEKEWCAREFSLLLGCEVQVFERNGVGYVAINGKESWHPMENWKWRDKTVEEFVEHLYNLWRRQSES